MNASSLGSVWGSYIRLRVIVVLRTCSNNERQRSMHQHAIQHADFKAWFQLTIYLANALRALSPPLLFKALIHSSNSCISRGTRPVITCNDMPT